jgi:hypothetical protein
MVRKTPIVIRGLLRGRDDMPFGRPTPGRLFGRRGVAHLQGVFGVYLLMISNVIS